MKLLIKNLYCISRKTEPRVSQIREHDMGWGRSGQGFVAGMKGQRTKQADVAQSLRFVIDGNILNHLCFSQELEAPRTAPSGEKGDGEEAPPGKVPAQPACPTTGSAVLPSRNHQLLLP